MQHAAIDNRTPFSFVHLFSYDDRGRPVVVAVSQATYAIIDDDGGRSTTHRLELLEEQPAIDVGGTLWEETADDLSPDPPRHEGEVVSYRVEPCVAYTKPATDVVLLGHASARAPGTTHLRVGLKLGPVQKVVRVHGDRFWTREGGEMVPSPARPFERIPLRYERAFGGWDKSHPDAEKHHAYGANPLGMGYRSENSEPEEGLRLPNIEDPEHPIERLGQAVPPAGFGFVSPGWEPRSRLAGTYDETWQQERMPYLPVDFDLRFFNAASPGLVTQGHLAGGEPVALFGVSRHEHMLFALPRHEPLRCTVERVAAEDATSPMPLDTVIIDTDAETVTLLFRGHVVLRDGPRDVRTIAISPKA